MQVTVRFGICGEIFIHQTILMRVIKLGSFMRITRKKCLKELNFFGESFGLTTSLWNFSSTWELSHLHKSTKTSRQTLNDRYSKLMSLFTSMIHNTSVTTCMSSMQGSTLRWVKRKEISLQ